MVDKVVNKRFTAFILDVERIGITSFLDTCQLCALADELGIVVRTKFGDKVIIAAPGTNPHELYEKVRS